MSLLMKTDLKQQVDDFLAKGFIHKFLCSPRPYDPQEGSAWCMCIDNKANNKIIINYKFLIIRLNDVLDMMLEAIIISMIHPRSSYLHIYMLIGD